MSVCADLVARPEDVRSVFHLLPAARLVEFHRGLDGLRATVDPLMTRHVKTRGLSFFGHRACAWAVNWQAF